MVWTIGTAFSSSLGMNQFGCYYLLLIWSFIIFSLNFIIFSNTAGNVINKKTLEYWNKGIKREEISYKVMEEVLMQSAFNDKGMFIYR